MLSQEKLERVLPRSGLGEMVYFFEAVPSTNLTALELAEKGAPHGTIVVAERQMAGRGRAGRSWTTIAGKSLAFSTLLLGKFLDVSHHQLLSMLGALAVVSTLREYGVETQIKWPNDVIYHDRKVAGLLTEAHWNGSVLAHIVVGIGINVFEGSLPEETSFPAATLQSTGSKLPQREMLLAEVVGKFGELLTAAPEEAWAKLVETEMAYRGREVVLSAAGERQVGTIACLQEDGSLALRLADGSTKLVQAGELSLRPVDR